VRLIAPIIAFFMRLRFDDTKAHGLDATFELRVRLLPHRVPVPLTLRVRDGDCTIRPGAAAEARATATVVLSDMIRLTLGLIGWPELLSNGRLELAGDPFLALRFPALFGLPAVGSAAHGRT
jgi:SCP-2 sterol transfer family